MGHIFSGFVSAYLREHSVVDLDAEIGRRCILDARAAGRHPVGEPVIEWRQLTDPAAPIGYWAVQAFVDTDDTAETVEPRINFTVRVSQDGIAAIDRLARQDNRKRSDMARILLAEAVAARAKQVRR